MNLFVRPGIQASYLYDELTGLRRGKVVNGQAIYFVLDDQERVVQELSSDGSLVSAITYGANGPETYTKDGQTYDYVLDAQGNVVALVDDAGNTVNSYSYDVWGQIESSNEAVFNPIRARGEYWDSESGLSYLRGRYYDSSTRRFTTSDPAEDGLNWFSYCGNNPLEYLDPSGYAYFRTQEKWGEDYVVTEYYSGDDLIKLLNTTSANSFLVGTVVGSITGWLSKLAPKTVIAAFTAVAWLRTLNAANISDMAKEAHAEKKGLRFQTTITQDSAVDVTERIYISAKDVEDYASGARKP